MPMPRLLVFLMMFLLALPLPAQTAPKRPGSGLRSAVQSSSSDTLSYKQSNRNNSYLLIKATSKIGTPEYKNNLIDETIALVGKLEREGKIQSYQTPDGQKALRIAQSFRLNYAGRFTPTLSPEDMDAGINLILSP